MLFCKNLSKKDRLDGKINRHYLTPSGFTYTLVNYDLKKKIYIYRFITADKGITKDNSDILLSEVELSAELADKWIKNIIKIYSLCED